MSTGERYETKAAYFSRLAAESFSIQCCCFKMFVCKRAEEKGLYLCLFMRFTSVKMKDDAIMKAAAINPTWFGFKIKCKNVL